MCKLFPSRSWYMPDPQEQPETLVKGLVATRVSCFGSRGEWLTLARRLP